MSLLCLHYNQDTTATVSFLPAAKGITSHCLKIHLIQPFDPYTSAGTKAFQETMLFPRSFFPILTAFIEYLWMVLQHSLKLIAKMLDI